MLFPDCEDLPLPGIWLADLSEEEKEELREEEELSSSSWLSHPSLRPDERSPSLLR